VKKKTPKDIGASVRARLLRLARERGEDFQLLLTRYANERLLYRLAQSRHGARFVLKGAALFTLWTGRPHRVTRDLDLLGFGDPSEAELRNVFADVLALDVGDDGVAFDPGSLEVGLIREDQEYGGIRIVTAARVTTASVRLQVDVGFGDAITPAPITVDFPALLDFPAPRLRAYPRETVVAEKLEAMVQLGLANSRMKDFYDLVVLSRLFEFDGELLSRAIRATFDRRRTPLPAGLPMALTSAFADDAAKKTQWTAFVRKTEAADAPDLPAAVAAIAQFVERPLAAAGSVTPWTGRWPPGGPWG
jgi:predicted nucleotidyltransferase component of viral defense system